MDWTLETKLPDGRWLPAWSNYGKPYTFKTLEAAEATIRELFFDYGGDVRIVGK